MNAESASTEAVVRHHLRAFLDQQGVTAIVSDYDDNASFCSETRIYRGKHEIADFFTEFIASLPVNAIERFTLRSLQVDRNIACITWSVGSDILLGTDTFVVHRGKIVSQTFAMLTAPGSMVPLDTVWQENRDVGLFIESTDGENITQDAPPHLTRTAG